MDVGFISTPLFDIFLYLWAPLVLVMFCNSSIRTRVYCKSEGIKFGTCSTCFVNFVSNSFLSDFVTVSMPPGIPFGTIFEKKKPFRKSFQKRRPPSLKFPHYQRVRWLPETPPLIILYKGRRLAGALNSNRIRVQVRFQLELEFDFSSSSNCGSNLCPSLSWLEFEIEKLLENCCLSWLRLQKFRKQFEKWKNWYQINLLLMIWHATGQKPGEL